MFDSFLPTAHIISVTPIRADSEFRSYVPDKPQTTPDDIGNNAIRLCTQKTPVTGFQKLRVSHCHLNRKA